MTPNAASILARVDAGHHPDAIAAALRLSLSRVYAILREHRPDRERKPRLRTSKKRGKILALHGVGTKPARIAVLVGCTRAHVYGVLAGAI